VATASKPISDPIDHHATERAIDLVPESWGPKRYSSMADIALTRRGPDAIDFEVASHFLLVLLTPQPRREIRLASSRPTIFDAPAGSVEAIPAGASFQGRWHVPKENILVSLDPVRLSEVAAREFDSGTVTFEPISPGLMDPTAAKIAGLLRDCLADDFGANSLYSESLTMALLLHFIRAHSSVGQHTAQRAFRGGLSPRTWRDLDDFIRANLASDMTLSMLADRAGLSYSHFLRAFRQTIGMSPHRYIMWQRAEHARALASCSDAPLKLIAQQCGFASQSHMTTVMKSLLQMTPGQLRREGKPGASFCDED
jgi:AraC family transcriptional regulator